MAVGIMMSTMPASTEEIGDALQRTDVRYRNLSGRHSQDAAASRPEARKPGYKPQILSRDGTDSTLVEGKFQWVGIGLVFIFLN